MHKCTFYIYQYSFFLSILLLLAMGIFKFYKKDNKERQKVATSVKEISNKEKIFDDTPIYVPFALDNSIPGTTQGSLMDEIFKELPLSAYSKTDSNNDVPKAPVVKSIRHSLTLGLRKNRAASFNSSSNSIDLSNCNKSTETNSTLTGPENYSRKNSVFTDSSVSSASTFSNPSSADERASLNNVPIPMSPTSYMEDHFDLQLQTQGIIKPSVARGPTTQIRSALSQSSTESTLARMRERHRQERQKQRYWLPSYSIPVDRTAYFSPAVSQLMITQRAAIGHMQLYSIPQPIQPYLDPTIQSFSTQVPCTMTHTFTPDAPHSPYYPYPTSVTSSFTPSSSTSTPFSQLKGKPGSHYYHHHTKERELPSPSLYHPKYRTPSKTQQTDLAYSYNVASGVTESSIHSQYANHNDIKYVVTHSTNNCCKGTAKSIEYCRKSTCKKKKRIDSCLGKLHTCHNISLESQINQRYREELDLMQKIHKRNCYSVPSCLHLLDKKQDVFEENDAAAIKVIQEHMNSEEKTMRLLKAYCENNRASIVITCCCHQSNGSSNRTRNGRQCHKASRIHSNVCDQRFR
ncbi:uncharacterized protein RHIMIDRAFT_311735 [Rhizopus microsporus ATCC 52813]|uniref:Uncharacterized protein n=1 Tax=Rhizopus microsporus ATCC 52813 TaxID=1340429 RepID=A0A2G4T498_RHIZD|nr:uncharacterized protein RHIMIDRAFT_311735 [Rhizopus microsporus ATCC 52813]PHZ15835.1 hypothetical protein RHIMIDRAFT_311735 [Rhizopus microsporus ATCC 52813]